MSEEPEYVRAARARALTGAQRDPNADTLRRELVRVESIPLPPRTEDPARATADAVKDGTPLSSAVTEQMVTEAIRNSISELVAKLGSFGVRLNPAQEADLVDHAFCVVAGFAGGGAIRGR